MKRQVITLWDIERPILIVPAKTGIFYSNQTGGCACNHPVVEGYLYALPHAGDDYEFLDPRVWYRLGGYSTKWPIPPEWRDAVPDNALWSDELRHNDYMKREASLWWDDLIETVEQMHDYEGWPQMRFQRDQPSEEAWVNVKARLSFQELDGEGTDATFTKGCSKWAHAILTWPNCD